MIITIMMMMMMIMIMIVTVIIVITNLECILPFQLHIAMFKKMQLPPATDP